MVSRMKNAKDPDHRNHICQHFCAPYLYSNIEDYPRTCRVCETIFTSEQDYIDAKREADYMRGYK